MTVYGQDLPTVGGSNDTWGTELNAVLNAAPTYTDRLQGCFTISPTNAQAEYLVFNARFPFDVKRVTYQCFPSGTATLDFKIEATSIGGLGSISATARS